MVDPGIQIKSVEGDALLADTDFNQIGADLRVEAVAVHPDVEGRIPQPDQARHEAGEVIRGAAHGRRQAALASGEGGRDRTRR